jgi:hypothetical protein
MSVAKQCRALSENGCGRIDRRELLQLGAGLGAALALPVGLTACDDGPPPPAGAAEIGHCELIEGVDLGFSGTHAALMPNGRVLYWGYDPTAEDNINTMVWREWDHLLGFAEAPTLLHHNRNLFCSGHCFLPDGRLLVAVASR